MDNSTLSQPKKLSTQNHPHKANETPQNGSDENISGKPKNEAGASVRVLRRKKKRSRRSSSFDGDNRPKRKFETDGILPSVCAVCKKSYPNHYLLLGHVLTHNKREWGGAYSPLVDDCNSSKNLEFDLNDVPQDHHPCSSSSSQLDLNLPPPKEEEKDGAAAS